MNTTESHRLSETNTTTETSEQLNARYATELLPLTTSLSLLTALGIIGNILTLLVFSCSKEYKRNTFRVFVIALAMIDLSACVTLFPTEMLTHRFYFVFQNKTLCKTKCFLTVFCASASSLALFVISADRYRKVMTPFKKQLTPSLTVKILFLFTFVIPALLSIPAAIMCGIHRTNKTNVYGGETEIHLCETEERYKASDLRNIYKFLLMILQLGISTVYVVLYAFVMKEALKHIKASRDRHTLNSTYSESSKQRQASVSSQQTKLPTKTLIWLVLTLVFIATYMTHLGLTLKVSEIVHMSTKEMFWFLFSFRLYFINHVINPVVYAVFLKSFRTSCKNIFSNRK